MAHLPVPQEPQEILRKHAKPIDPKEIGTPAMNQFIADMKETMEIEDGVGIAAPQVAVGTQVVIVDTPGKGPRAYFNPKIIERSFKLVDSPEGCLSVRGTSGVVKRHRSVTVETYNEEGEKETIKANGFYAIVWQHEVDHLDRPRA